jgi:glycosyltransferase involved in cell wall biosynthesis
VSDPLVSILIPTYNGERVLRPALRSALEQSYKNIEVVVADDASTDRTAEILASVAASDPRVRVIRRETNVGAFHNPLRLLEEAHGDYLKFLLHDDVLATDCVRDLLRGMQSTPDATLAFSRRVLIDENGRTRTDGQPAALMDRPGRIDGRELGDAVLEGTANVIGEFTTVLFRRSDIELDSVWQTDGRNLDVLTDVQLFLLLLGRGSAFYDPRALSRFRIHGSQSTFNPRYVARGVRDWALVVDWGVRQGFLAAEDKQRRAFARVLQMGAARVASLIEGDDYGPALETVYLATQRLVELGVDSPVDVAASLPQRAHGRAALDRCTQELDVWTREYPVALAAPSLVAQEMTATIQAFRDLLGAGVAKKLMIAVPEPLVDQAVPLVEAALAEGPDIDVEVVPTDDPGRLLTGPWLAVAPRGRTWHNAWATAAWTIDPATEPTRVRLVPGGPEHAK